MKILSIIAGMSALGILLTACSNSSLLQEDFSAEQKLAILQISDALSEQCVTEGFTPDTDGFNTCYWNQASAIRGFLLDRKEAELLASGSHFLNANDPQAQIFRNRDNADARVWFESTREERARDDEIRGSRR